MSKRTERNPARTGPFARNFLEPCAALLACPDHRGFDLKELFENVACDWRLTQAVDGAEAARHIMNKGLPNLLLVGTRLSTIDMPDFVEWIRSFRAEPAVTIVVHGSPDTTEARELLLRSEVSLILPSDCPRPVLTQHLVDLVGAIEKRRFRPVSAF